MTSLISDNDNNIGVMENKKNNFDNNNSIIKSSPVHKVTKLAPEDPRVLIPELCRHFYSLGWASGTGGGLSIRQDGLIYCAPSGVQKERIQPEDMFILDEACNVLQRPKSSKLKVSECLSLFNVAFKLRDAGCCIHSHSLYANLVTAMAMKQKNAYEFRCKNQEMIKGIRVGSSDKTLNYNDTLVVPIIDNVLYERDLAGAMDKCVREYPRTNAVLVRNHGVYVWGRNWKEAKSMAECYDYLFKLKVEAFKCGFDWMLDE